MTEPDAALRLAQIRDAVTARDDRGRTHWDGCETDPKHRDCAIVFLFAALARAEQTIRDLQHPPGGMVEVGPGLYSVNESSSVFAVSHHSHQAAHALEPARDPQSYPVKGCDHKFVDSTRCLKCGWTPTDDHVSRRDNQA